MDTKVTETPAKLFKSSENSDKISSLLDFNFFCLPPTAIFCAGFHKTTDFQILTH